MHTHKHQISTDIIAAAMVAIVAIAVGSQCLTAGKSGGADTAGIAGAEPEAAPIMLAQYNPCPNGRCR
jgi:hypothetical protein